MILPYLTSFPPPPRLIVALGLDFAEGPCSTRSILSALRRANPNGVLQDVLRLAFTGRIAMCAPSQATVMGFHAGGVPHGKPLDRST